MSDHIPPKTTTVRNDGGFTIIEVLVAVAIFSIGFLAVGLMQIGAMNRTITARQNTEAMTVCDDRAELLMSMPFYIDDFDVLWDLGAATDAAPHEVDVEGPYTVRWSVTDDAPLPPYADGMFTTGKTLTRSKTIRVWVTPDHNPNDIQSELMFSKFRGADS